MKCPCCGKDTLLRELRDVPYTYRGKVLVIKSVKGDFCSSCGEIILDRENGDRYGDEVSIFRRQVDSRN